MGGAATATTEAKGRGAPAPAAARPAKTSRAHGEGAGLVSGTSSTGAKHEGEGRCAGGGRRAEASACRSPFEAFSSAAQGPTVSPSRLSKAARTETSSRAAKHGISTTAREKATGTTGFGRLSKAPKGSAASQPTSPAAPT